VKRVVALPLAIALLAVVAIRLVGEQRERVALQTFAFAFRSATGERVDSRAGTVTKDMVSAPDTTIALRLSPGEMRVIYETCRRVHLLDVHEPQPELRNVVGGRVPAFAWDFDVTMEGKQKHFEIRTSAVMDPPPPQWVALHTAVDSVLTIVRRRPEYRGLPPFRGGYL
jgi:hypothetical protein